MKLITSILFASVLTAIVAIDSDAGAQPAGAQPGAHRSAATTTTRTAAYTEQIAGGDQAIEFTGDELPAPPNGACGTSIRPLPGVTRLGLIRPRANFVTELLKSVENL